MTAGTQSSKPWYKTWKLIPAILFFPFTLMYLTWKTKWPLPAKMVIIFLILVSLAGTSSSSESNTETKTNIEDTPKEIVANEEKTVDFTLEQKQEDYKNFYKEFITQGQLVVITQVTLIESSNDPQVTPEELYLTLDNLSKAQDSISMKTTELNIPNSLKEYKKLSSGKMKLAVASRHFKSAIENFQKYLNKNDFEALSDAKYKSGLGETQLEESINDVESVGKELEIDIDSLKVNN